MNKPIKAAAILSLASSVLFFWACQPQASIEVDPTFIEAPAQGGTYQATVKANYSWTATAMSEHITISPSSGNGDSPVTITVGQNPLDIGYSEEILFQCTGGGNTATATIRVSQTVEQASLEIEGDTDSYNMDFDGGSTTIKVTSNYPWEAEHPEGITMSRTTGEAGSTDVTVTAVPNSDDLNAQSYDIKFTCEGGGLSEDITITITVAKFALNYEGVDYKLGRMADGRVWMTENLRYIPEGKTPSSDPSDNAGIWYPCYLTGTALTSDEDIAKYGYLYAPTLALGVTIEDFASDINIAEGKQGICPDGWHIPTEAEADSLLHAYWDEEIQKGAPISVLEEAGFNPGAIGGMINRSSSTATGRYMDTDSGFFLTSTGYQYKVTEATGSISSMNRAIMRTNTKTYQRFTIANASNYAGVSIRCIKDQAE